MWRKINSMILVQKECGNENGKYLQLSSFFGGKLTVEKNYSRYLIFGGISLSHPFPHTIYDKILVPSGIIISVHYIHINI